ncbi:MAG: hypothetical protein IJY03_04690 [Prevotella sp.]|nr:hypothetical protein [Prevotella sp.]
MKRIPKFITVFLLFFVVSIHFSCSNKQLKESASTEQVSQREADSLLLEKCKKLYTKLDSIKDTKDFPTYGFSVDGPYSWWLNEIHAFSESENKSLFSAYGITQSDIEQVALDYVNSNTILSVEEIKAADERRNRVERILYFGIRLDSDFSSEIASAINNSSKTILGRWKLTAHQAKTLSYILEVFSVNDNYYFTQSYTNGNEPTSGKLIRRGHAFYEVPSVSGDYFVILDDILFLADDGGEYEDGTKGLYSITPLK